jgi:hypothetical protein
MPWMRLKERGEPEAEDGGKMSLRYWASIRDFEEHKKSFYACEESLRSKGYSF